MGVALGLLLALPASAAPSADQTLVISCQFDPMESGAGVVAGGLGGVGVWLRYDLSGQTVYFRNGTQIRLSKMDSDTLEFEEQEFTVSYHRDSGDLISHDGKTGNDATFHCVPIVHQN